jgi:hypothetical protein
MADSTSVPIRLYRNFPLLKYDDTNGLQNISLGNLVNNCDVEEDCPKAYYKRIDYTYDGKPITLSNIKLDDFDFSLPKYADV